MKRDQVIAGLRSMTTPGNEYERVGLAKYALRLINDLEERVKLLESPARNVIRMAEADCVDTHALLNAQLKRIEAQRREIARITEVRDSLLFALENLYALINGECPSLLEDDHLDTIVSEAIKKAKRS